MEASEGGMNSPPSGADEAAREKVDGEGGGDGEPSAARVPARQQVVECRCARAGHGAIGLFAFALTTYVAMGPVTGMVGREEGRAVLGPLALFYGGAVQLLAGAWAWTNRDVLGATAFPTYGAFWLAIGLYEILQGAGVQAERSPEGLAMLLAGFGFLSLIFMGMAARKDVAHTTVFALLAPTFFLLVAGEFVNGAAIAGGALGIATALAAFYTGAAVLANDVYQRPVIPLGQPLLT